MREKTTVELKPILIAATIGGILWLGAFEVFGAERTEGILSRPAPAGSIRAFFGAPVISHSEDSYRNEQRRQWRRQKQWNDDAEMRYHWNELREQQREFHNRRR